MSRFDYVKYDDVAIELQAKIKSKFTELENLINQFGNSRATSLVHTKLEEAYMWTGKAIRDEQIERNQHTGLQEERTNS